MNELTPENNWAMTDWGPSLTEQSHAEDCNINNLIRRYIRPENIPARAGFPSYADVSEVSDYLDCFEQVRAAEAMYDALPDSVHERFASAQEFLEFAENPENLSALQAMGLANSDGKITAVEPKKVSDVAETAQKTE